MTQLNLSVFSVVLAFGFTAATGTIKFAKPNGDFILLPIGLFGPSAGLSIVPNLGNLLSRFPFLAKFFSRFNFEKILSDKLLLFWIDTQFKALHLGANITSLIRKLIEGLTGSHANWWSVAIGEAFGSRGRELNKIDFSGPCICYSLGATVTEANFGIFVLFFGLDRDAVNLIASNPILLLDLMKLEGHAKGVAIISSACVSASLPGLGAGATILVGAIT